MDSQAFQEGRRRRRRPMGDPESGDAGPRGPRGASQGPPGSPGVPQAPQGTPAVYNVSGLSITYNCIYIYIHIISNNIKTIEYYCLV